MTAVRFEPSNREVSNTLIAMTVMGPWGIYGLYDYFDDHDESEWEPHYDTCVNCYGKGYLENYRECTTCGTSGSLLVALHLNDMREAPEPYIATLLRQKRGTETVNKLWMSDDDYWSIYRRMT